MRKFIGTAVVLIGIAGSAFGAVTAVPEVDSSTAVAALALLGGGLLILNTRRKK